MKVDTAKEFIKEKDASMGEYWSHDSSLIAEIMIEFAQEHVRAALKAISIKARIIDDPNSYTGNTGSEYYPEQIVDKDSILNAYSIENIK